jgi:hypothetical protein
MNSKPKTYENYMKKKNNFHDISRKHRTHLTQKEQEAKDTCLSKLQRMERLVRKRKRKRKSQLLRWTIFFRAQKNEPTKKMFEEM